MDRAALEDGILKKEFAIKILKEKDVAVKKEVDVTTVSPREDYAKKEAQRATEQNQLLAGLDTDVEKATHQLASLRITGNELQISHTSMNKDMESFRGIWSSHGTLITEVEKDLEELNVIRGGLDVSHLIGPEGSVSVARSAARAAFSALFGRVNLEELLSEISRKEAVIAPIICQYKNDENAIISLSEQILEAEQLREGEKGNESEDAAKMEKMHRNQLREQEQAASLQESQSIRLFRKTQDNVKKLKEAVTEATTRKKDDNDAMNRLTSTLTEQKRLRQEGEEILKKKQDILLKERARLQGLLTVLLENGRLEEEEAIQEQTAIETELEGIRRKLEEMEKSVQLEKEVAELEKSLLGQESVGNEEDSDLPPLSEQLSSLTQLITDEALALEKEAELLHETEFKTAELKEGEARRKEERNKDLEEENRLADEAENKLNQLRIERAAEAEKEDGERRKREEEDKQRKKAEEERKKREMEEEKKRKEKEEDERKKKKQLEAERKRKEEEERKKRQQEAERKQKEEEERKKRQQEAERKKKEEERKRKELETERRKKRIEEEERAKRQKMEEERTRRQKVEEERAKRQKMEEERTRMHREQEKEEEERRRKQREQEKEKESATARTLRQSQPRRDFSAFYVDGETTDEEDDGEDFEVACGMKSPPRPAPRVDSAGARSQPGSFGRSFSGGTGTSSATTGGSLLAGFDMKGAVTSTPLTGKKTTVPTVVRGNSGTRGARGARGRGRARSKKF